MPAGDDDAFDIDPRSFLAVDESPGELADEQSSAWSPAAGIASLERIEQELADVEHVLTRLDDGRYGTCDTCGSIIPEARLAAHPVERFCADHSASR